FLQGRFQPQGNDDRFGLARLCTYQKRHRTAALLYADAFAAEPKRADDLRALHRYNAACNAARTGCNLGEDARALDEKERTRWRQQALDWLRADLAARARQLETGKPEDRQDVQRVLRHWREDSDLAGLREAAALAKLPADEPDACQKLWADVAALLQ